MKKIINVHRYDKKNAGDMASAPMRYFKYYGYENYFLDFLKPPKEIVECDILIIGGGGLISTKVWFDLLYIWINKIKAKKYILWGVGIDKEYQLKELYNDFNLIGCRQENTIFTYIPCASCMLKIFDKHINKSGKGEVRISHYKRMIPKSESTNIDKFEDNIYKISISEKVITTSYHIWYWAKLLDKKVEIYHSKNFEKPLAEKMYYLQTDLTLESARNINIKYANEIYNQFLTNE